MILVDLSQIVFSGVHVDLAKELKKGTPDPSSNKLLIKHMVFMMLIGLKKKFSKEYGEMVLCADAKNYWRKEFFPAYKGHRKHDRSESNLDYNLIYETIDEIKVDINENFPWPLIEVESAEGDDVIAVLVKYLQTNELVKDGLFEEEPQKNIIISSDGDLVQLQRYNGVVQWNNQHKKWIKTANVHEYLIEHIASGDTGDNIPTIMTPDQWANDRAAGVKPARQAPLRASIVRDLTLNDPFTVLPLNLHGNWIRNQKLIDFSFIPKEVEEKIIDTYKITCDSRKNNKMKLMNYFMKNKMAKLMSELSDI